MKRRGLPQREERGSQRDCTSPALLMVSLLGFLFWFVMMFRWLGGL